MRWESGRDGKGETQGGWGGVTVEYDGDGF
jgi:hypothetical protein